MPTPSRAGPGSPRARRRHRFDSAHRTTRRPTPQTVRARRRMRDRARLEAKEHAERQQVAGTARLVVLPLGANPERFAEMEAHAGAVCDPGLHIADETTELAVKGDVLIERRHADRGELGRRARV